LRSRRNTGNPLFWLKNQPRIKQFRFFGNNYPTLRPFVAILIVAVESPIRNPTVLLSRHLNRLRKLQQSEKATFIHITFTFSNLSNERLMVTFWHISGLQNAHPASRWRLFRKHLSATKTDWMDNSQKAPSLFPTLSGMKRITQLTCCHGSVPFGKAWAVYKQLTIRVI
jgi:hypothetical protein